MSKHVLQRAMITLLTTGNPIGSVVTKSNWLTNDFEICDEQGNVHFFIKSKEKIFSASEYPVNNLINIFLLLSSSIILLLTLYYVRSPRRMGDSWEK